MYKKHDLKIATYNVRTLSTTEKYFELVHTIHNIHLDILGLAETRRMGCKIEEYTDYILCYVGETPGQYGVGFLIKKEYKNNIVNFWGLSERVALIQLQFGDTDLSIIQVYAPTSDSDEKDLEKFYQTLEEAHNLLRNCRNIMVIGDFNAKIGKPKCNESLIMGKFGYGVRNSRGERLVQYALEYKLSIMNTYFNKKNSRKWTWISPDGKTKNELDFIMCNNPKNITNTEVLNNVDFPSDHRIVRATLSLKIPKKCRRNFSDSISSLKTDVEIKTYLRKLETNFPDPANFNEDNIQETYNKFELHLKNSLKSEAGNKNKTNEHTCYFFNETTKALIRRRTELINTKNKSCELKKELSILFKRISKLIRNDYKRHRQKIIENSITQHRSAKKAYKQLITHTDWIKSLKNGQKETKSRKDLISCATNFYKELYSTELRDMTTSTESDSLQTNISDTAIIKELDVWEHIKKLKREKSPGPDGLKNDALIEGAKLLTVPLTRIFNLVLRTGIIPEQWQQSDIILLYKKGDPLDIANYRPISLLSSVYKLFTSIIHSKISSIIDGAQPIEQAGFRPGFSTMDHIHTLDQVLEKYSEFNKDLYIGFIDYTKAFDSLYHSSIWQALHNCNLDPMIIRTVKNIYQNSVSRVKLEVRGEEFKIARGVRQGDPLSPKLFLAVLQDIFSKLNWISEGIPINNDRLTHLRFADDIAIFAETPKKLQNMISQLNKESKHVGLHMNLSKTKVMTNGKKGKIMLDGVELVYVEQYTYLGKQVSFSKSNNEDEVHRRVTCSWNKYWAHKEILKGNYDSNMKKTIMDTCILPCLIYGSQTWTFTNKISNKIRTCQRAMERSMLHLRKIQKTRSQEIRKKTKLTDALHQALKLKWSWAGHVARCSDQRWTIKTTKWIGPQGKRNVGRPQKRWADDIIATAGKSWMTIAREREKWKKLEEAYTLPRDSYN
ncbi:LINE-1 reverse transcriptase homolog [Bicyclus anynana]|uniref:LINE-1 reverse transcriptase homolog n=1 Tax=Bicyclus anynana TaxID=110368 RepID=A0A6J1NSM7_BICAN|nr:LINE-1 reverse transcriptase homolog [Bicyclus anynana]